MHASTVHAHPHKRARRPWLHSEAPEYVPPSLLPFAACAGRTTTGKRSSPIATSKAGKQLLFRRWHTVMRTGRGRVATNSTLSLSLSLSCCCLPLCVCPKTTRRCVLCTSCLRSPYHYIRWVTLLLSSSEPCCCCCLRWLGRAARKAATFTRFFRHLALVWTQNNHSRSSRLTKVCWTNRPDQGCIYRDRCRNIDREEIERRRVASKQVQHSSFLI